MHFCYKSSKIGSGLIGKLTYHVSVSPKFPSFPATSPPKIKGSPHGFKISRNFAFLCNRHICYWYSLSLLVLMCMLFPAFRTVRFTPTLWLPAPLQLPPTSPRGANQHQWTSTSMDTCILRTACSHLNTQRMPYTLASSIWNTTQTPSSSQPRRRSGSNTILESLWHSSYM